MQLRVANEDDVAAIEALYEAEMPWPIPNAQRAVKEQHVRVAEAQDGSVIGFRTLTKGGFVWIAVAPDQRRRGIGSRLMDDVLEQAAELELSDLSTQVDERSAAGNAFCERFAFKPFLHALNLELDVRDWDEAALTPMLNQAKASGIEFKTFAELCDTEENRQRLYVLNKTLNATIPRDQPQPFTPYEIYVKGRIANPTMPHDGIFIALDGDQWVGMTQVALVEGVAYNQMTGVLPQYRGRGIAQALKLLLIRFVAQHECPIIRTFNDVTNPAMIAVNEKAGFQRGEPFYRLRRHLAADT
ncbi:MAG: GNAT family N-acetyltransferase [Chloroflexi bacterium]|nr:GNAT family N-acetyltransferase [Chloroflexota bacterium]